VPSELHNGFAATVSNAEARLITGRWA
jgi:hypothetical protein